MCRCHLISVPFLWNKDPQALGFFGSCSSPASSPGLLHQGLSCTLSSGCVLSQPWHPTPPHPSISLGLTAFNSTGGHICLYLKHIGLSMILGLRTYIFNWEKNNNPVGFISKLMMNTGLNMLVQSVYKNHLLPPLLIVIQWLCLSDAADNCKAEMLSLLLLAALLSANPVSNSQHWQIRCWSCWIWWEGVCSSPLQAAWLPRRAGS